MCSSAKMAPQLQKHYIHIYIYNIMHKYNMKCPVIANWQINIMKIRKKNIKAVSEQIFFLGFNTQKLNNAYILNFQL